MNSTKIMQHIKKRKRIWWSVFNLQTTDKKKSGFFLSFFFLGQISLWVRDRVRACQCERVICVWESAAKGSWCFCTWRWRKLRHSKTSHTHINSKYRKPITKLEARKMFKIQTVEQHPAIRWFWHSFLFPFLFNHYSLDCPFTSLVLFISCLSRLYHTLFPVLSLSSFVCFDFPAWPRSSVTFALSGLHYSF